eukprot:PhF_6_TR25597/c0_g1_i1/m.35911
MGCGGSKGAAALGDLMKAVGNKNLVIATYGGLNVTDRVQVLLKKDQETLKVQPGKYVELFTDPAKGEYKDFTIVTLDNSATPHKFRVNVFNDEDACEVKPGPGPCDTHNTPEITADSILLANYGGKDITAEIKERFSKENRIEITEPHKTYTDPMPNVVKAFLVVYRYVYSDGIQYQCANWWMDGTTIVINKAGAGGGAAAAAAGSGSGYNGPLVAIYGGRDVSTDVLGWYKDEKKVDVDPGTYTTHLTDHAVNEYKTFSVIHVDYSVTPNKFLVAHYEDEEHCDVTPGVSGPCSDGGGNVAIEELYYANYGGMDVTADLKQILVSQGEFKCTAVNKIWEDPMPGVVKAFFVSYLTKWEGTNYRTANFWYDGETVDILYLPSSDTSLIEASFGGHDVTDAVYDRMKSSNGHLVVEPGQYTSWLSDPFPNVYKAFTVINYDDKNSRCVVNYYDDEDKCDINPDNFVASTDKDAATECKAILRAVYGGMDVTEDLQRILAEKGSFNEAPSEAFGDPWNGVVKSFVIVYLTEYEGTPDRAANYWMDGEIPKITLKS